MDYWTRQRNCDAVIEKVAEKMQKNAIDEEFKGLLKEAIAVCG